MKFWLASLLSLVPLGSTFALEPFSIVGRCQRYLSNHPDFDPYEYVMMNDGEWRYNTVPNTPDNVNLASAFLRNQPTGQDNLFITMIYSQKYGEDLHPHVIETTTVGEDGSLTVHPTGSSNDLKIVMLLYRPGKLAYYHICSDTSDYDGDTRFVITHEYEPNPNDLSEMSSIEQRYQFKGDLKQL